MKILIVKISALGDIVHALPAALYLRNRLPEAEIHWLVEESFVQLLKPLPYLDYLLPLNSRAVRKNWSLGEWKHMVGIIGRIRETHYDCVFDLQGNTKSGFFTFISGATKRFGFDSAAVREWPNLLATNRRIEISQENFHIADRSLSLVSAAFPGGMKPLFGECLKPDPQSLNGIKQWLAEENIGAGKVIVCHPGTTWKTKMWHRGSWTQLLRYFHDRTNLHFVLTWGNRKEKELDMEIRRESGGRPVLWRGGDIRDLVALLSRADLVIGGDTGPVHIAAALDRPTVTLFRATDARRNAPRGSNHLYLQAPLDCSPCLLKQCAREGECSRSISVEEVAGAVEQLLAPKTIGGE